MSIRNSVVLLVALFSLTFLIACGGAANPVAPPSGGSGNGNLNGTYVFSVSGEYAMAGTLIANAGSSGGSACNTKGQITGGTLDVNYGSGPVADASITDGSYCIGTDGRGQVTVTTNIGDGFPNLTFDFVLQDSSHGLVIEFDSFGTGTGTIDAQTANVTPSGPYAFLFSAFDSSMAGNFTVGSGGAISAGTADFNEGEGVVHPNEPLTGNVVVSSTAPSTTLSAGPYTNLVFDVFPIDSTHLKFIEMDTLGIRTGDAFSQSSTAMPTGTLAFTLNGQLAESGCTACPTTYSSGFAAGGFMVTDGAGNITSSSSEDYNEQGFGFESLSPSPSPSFTGTYAATADNPGRYTLSGFSGFTGGSTYAAYPSSGGVLLLEIDTAGVTTGAAYAQTSEATLAASEGYGLYLSGNFGGGSEYNPVVVDIAEFTANSSGTTLTGKIDENSISVTYGSPLSGTYSILTGGRGEIAATAGTSSSNTTINGGFSLMFYSVDGTNFPFMENDSCQVATGVFVKQSSPLTFSSATKSHAMFVPHPLSMPIPHGRRGNKADLGPPPRPPGCF